MHELDNWSIAKCNVIRPWHAKNYGKNLHLTIKILTESQLLLAMFVSWFTFAL